MDRDLTIIYIMVILVILLSGCGAVYSYERSADSCTLTIVSAREVVAGDVSLDENCAISGRADSLTANEKALDAIGALVKKIP